MKKSIVIKALIKEILTVSIILSLLMLSFRTSHAAESICPGGSNPDKDVIFCDDFEDGTWLNNPNWEAGFFCGEGGESVKPGGFNSNYAAYTGNNLYYDSQIGYDCKFAGISLGNTSNEYYMRLYIKFSSGFQWGATSDKGLFFCDAGVNWCVKIEYSQWGSGKPGFSSYQHPGERLFQNQGNDIAWQTNKWYLLEWYVKLNTPGVGNGIVKMWLDDASVPIGAQTLRLHYTDVIHRESGQNQTMGHIRLFEYHNGCIGSGCPSSLPQWIAWDQLVVSKTQIGPMGQSVTHNKIPNAAIINSIQ